MNNDIQAEAGPLSRKLPSNIGTVHRIHKNTWKIAFVFAFKTKAVVCSSACFGIYEKIPFLLCFL